MPQSPEVHYWIEQITLFGDHQAFEKLYLHYYDHLFKFAFSIVKNEKSAEEIVSDTFLNIWRNRLRLLEIENIKLYLYVSVKNLSLRHIRKNKGRGTYWLDDHLIEEIGATTQNPEDLLVTKELFYTIQQAIEELPPKCKLIFKMVREDGMKYKEIAQLLSISVKTIDAQMAIASKRILESIKLSVKK
ncbi:RNA polymerase sigma-70 factor [Flavihumibacter sp. CACIAM 22H1]|uniref:RNA polymerase sigma-70 factor n=1 Tax=Flavihumibacter sp. CACIAM 22H1 TaxID=1812911 RepID=UPI0007A87DD5|nr:RNA polymerase sigma-70 factor [Flavihumibacter sp. CACIAM 22H1]KYP15275.1 MAG: hypothetical protein A1D16_10980 [Flavihumibacter sp. CACIAM 22H1]